MCCNLQAAEDIIVRRSYSISCFTSITSAGPPDTARLLMRIHQSDGSSCFFDNMEDRPITSEQWLFYEITGTVCLDAVDLELGMQLWGDGSALLDDASLSFSGRDQPFAAVQSSSQDQQGRQEARIRELITKFADARNKHDLSTLISLYAEDAEAISSTSQGGSTCFSRNGYSLACPTNGSRSVPGKSVSRTTFSNAATLLFFACLMQLRAREG